jgi:hypothetical protein
MHQDVAEFVRDGVVGLRLGGVEGYITGLWHSTFEIFACTLGVHQQPLFAPFTFFAII